MTVKEKKEMGFWREVLYWFPELLILPFRLVMYLFRALARLN